MNMKSVLLIKDSNMSFLSPESQKKLIEQFIPKELISANWSCLDSEIMKNLSNLIDGSKGQIRLNTKCFHDAFQAFISFPGCHEYFGMKDREVFNTNVFTYQNLGKNTEYMYKKDIYALLGTTLENCPLKGLKKKLCLSLANCFLRMKEKSLTTSHEMAPVSKEQLIRMSKNATILNEAFKYDTFDSLIPGGWKSINKSIECIAAYYCEAFDDKKEYYYDGILELLQKFSQKFPLEENLSEYERIMFWVTLHVAQFKTFIDENRLSMLSRSETIQEIKSSKIPIRLFQNDSELFVMTAELLHNLKTEKMDISNLDDGIRNAPRLSTLTLQQVFQELPKEILRNVDFVNVPITMTLYGSTPIPTVNGGHCVLTSEFFRNFVANLVTIKKIFHGKDPISQWDSVEQISQILNEFLIDESDFIDLEDINKFKTLFEQWYDLTFPSAGIKEHRVFKRAKFTVENLKKELELLGVVDVFPQILDLAEKMYTNELSDAKHFPSVIELLQIMCAIDRLPKLASLIHEKEWCRKGLCVHCVMCYNSSQQSVEVPTVRKEKEEEEKCLETQSDIEKTTVEDCSPSEDQEPVSLEDVVQDERAKKRQEKKNRQKHKKILEPTEKPEQKESQVCPKCSRASEHTRNANEKLRLEKIETKALKKKLAEMEKKEQEAEQREQEKDLKIRMLEQQLKAVQDELAKNKEVVQQYEIKEQEKEVQVQEFMNEILEVAPSTSSESAPEFFIQENTEVPLEDVNEVSDNVEPTVQDVEFEEFAETEVTPEIAPKVSHTMPALSPSDSQVVPEAASEEDNSNEPTLLEPVNPNELADSECLICLEEMEEHDETIKCEVCKRRYCGDCIREWFETKRTCPACNSGLLDQEEFPALS